MLACNKPLLMQTIAFTRQYRQCVNQMCFQPDSEDRYSSNLTVHVTCGSSSKMDNLMFFMGFNLLDVVNSLQKKAIFFNI